MKLVARVEIDDALVDGLARVEVGFDANLGMGLGLASPNSDLTPNPGTRGGRGILAGAGPRSVTPRWRPGGARGSRAGRPPRPLRG